MEKENIEILSDAIREYFGIYELEEFCSRFTIGNVSEIEYNQSPGWMAPYQYIPVWGIGAWCFRQVNV
jgi:hypothetical protein